jgi:hypothetical protein
MLKDGKFIKEPPPKIGAFWVAPYKQRELNNEERLAEALYRGYNPERMGLTAKLINALLRI